MVKNIFSYAINTSSILLTHPERRLLIEEMKRYFVDDLASYSFGMNHKSEATGKAVNWLLLAQQCMKDNGIGSYHLHKKWSSSYPETTGYAIPTLLDYAKKKQNNILPEKVLDAVNWLLEIQKESGGWQGKRVDDKMPETVFNTAQVIRGMIAAFEYTKEKKYLEAAIKAADWLCMVQSPQGYWQKFAFMNVPRVYDTYVDHPLLMVYQLVHENKYRQSAVKNLNWAIEKKQHKNGWFEDCDNTIKHNDRPILHTIAYTIDGLLECGLILENEKYIDAAILPSRTLLQKFLKDGWLNGRYDKDWIGSEYMICTGCAQISIVWSKLYKYSGDELYLKGVEKMNNLLLAVQDRKCNVEGAAGALSGSFPLWGKYEPFAFPNWATKYFIDSLLLEFEIKMQ